ncbi:MAG: hypothetical protein MUC69_01085 [Gemmatimonadales bacterium]|jgi:hypothetical protein|nr:hypothetical protein [Gemmatimonadales bacterium]
MTERLPARFDQETLERIMQRAAELQAAEGDAGANLSSDEIMALGKEVGIPERHLRRAMLEVQATPAAPEPAGALDRLSGPRVVTAQRVVALDHESVERLLLRALDEEAFRVQRQQAGRITWEPARGWQAFMRRSMQGTRPLMLQRANLVGATVMSLEPGFCHVALTAELAQVRSQYLGGAAAIASTAVAGTAVMLALGAFLPVALAPLPFAAGLGWGITRQFRPIADRTRLGLEVVLDQLERAGTRPAHALPPRTVGLIGQIATEVRRALESPGSGRR